jgi:hypothetical protein
LTRLTALLGSALLACAVLAAGDPAAQAQLVPGTGQGPPSALTPPAGCTISGGSFTAAPSGAPSKVNISYEGLSWGPACVTTAANFHLMVNLWTQNGRYWGWTSDLAVFNRTPGAASIPPGRVTLPCKHLATVKGVINYIVGPTKQTYVTNLTHCS